MTAKSLMSLVGILLAAMTAEFNDLVTSIALADVRGGFGISRDPGTWIQSLYISAEIIGMVVSSWFMVTFTMRRWTLFSIAFCGVTSFLIPFSPTIEAIYVLRALQGLAGGLIIPLLMITALRALSDPNVRIYGLAFYALSASFTASMAPSLAALWTDMVVDWRFVFIQAVPLCGLAATLVWYSEPQDAPAYGRFRMFDWRGFLLFSVGFTAFSTMLIQGDRLDWFNSPAVCVMALLSAIFIPLFLLNEWFHPLPLIKLQMLGRRNFAYGVIALFTFLIIAQASSTVPLGILAQVKGFRPLQSNLLTVEIAALQILLLPAVAFLLDFRFVDPRLISFAGLSLILAACIGSAQVDYTWTRDQFYLWETLQAIGQPMVVLPLLEMATNVVRGAPEAPFASALVNTPRGISSAVGIWFFQLVARWRGDLHSDRIVDQLGQNRFQLLQGHSVLTGLPVPPLPHGQFPAPGTVQALAGAVQQQVIILTGSDTFLALAAVAVGLMLVLLVLPVRTLPPRIVLAR